MLECAHAKPLNVRWEYLPSRTKLPFRWDLDARQEPAAWQSPNCRRRFARTALRSLAILVHDHKLYAVYTRDVSRQGIGFFSPINLFPREKIWLELPGQKVLRLCVARCLRVADACYACGAMHELLATDEGVRGVIAMHRVPLACRPCETRTRPVAWTSPGVGVRFVGRLRFGRLQAADCQRAFQQAGSLR